MRTVVKNRDFVFRIWYIFLGYLYYSDPVDIISYEINKFYSGSPHWYIGWTKITGHNGSTAICHNRRWNSTLKQQIFSSSVGPSNNQTKKQALLQLVGVPDSNEACVWNTLLVCYLPCSGLKWKRITATFECRTVSGSVRKFSSLNIIRSCGAVGSVIIECELPWRWYQCIPWKYEYL